MANFQSRDRAGPGLALNGSIGQGRVGFHLLDPCPTLIEKGQGRPTLTEGRVGFWPIGYIWRVLGHARSEGPNDGAYRYVCTSSQLALRLDFCLKEMCATWFKYTHYFRKRKLHYSKMIDNPQLANSLITQIYKKSARSIHWFIYIDQTPKIN